MKEKLRIMISFFSSQTKSLACTSRASRLPCGRLRLALTPSRRMLTRRRLAKKKKCEFLVGLIIPKSVTYVSVRLLPFSPVQTPFKGLGVGVWGRGQGPTGPGSTGFQPVGTPSPTLHF
jgi:hypothetical protein